MSRSSRWSSMFILDSIRSAATLARVLIFWTTPRMVMTFWKLLCCSMRSLVWRHHCPKRVSTASTTYWGHATHEVGRGLGAQLVLREPHLFDGREPRHVRALRLPRHERRLAGAGRGRARALAALRQRVGAPRGATGRGRAAAPSQQRAGGRARAPVTAALALGGRRHARRAAALHAAMRRFRLEWWADGFKIALQRSAGVLCLYRVPRPHDPRAPLEKSAGTTMRDPEPELAQALRALALGSVPASAASALFRTGGTALALDADGRPEGSRFARHATLARLRRVDRVLAAYLRASRAERKPEARVWRFLASDDGLRAVLGDDGGGAPLYRSLLALLYAVVNVREGFAALPPHKKSRALAKALVAAKVYLAWLQLPGGSAYGIFMPYVYRQVLDLLRKWVVLMAKQPDEDGGKGTGGRRRAQAQKARKGRRRAQIDDDDGENDVDDDTSGSDEEAELTRHRQLTQFGLDLLDMLGEFVRNSSLAASRESIMPTIETQVYLQTAVAPASDATNSAMTEKTREVLVSLIAGSHGDAMEIARGILHCYIPGLSFQDVSAKENRSALRFHKLSVEIVDQVEHQLHVRLDSDGVDSDDIANRLSSLRLALLQNICMQSPDRSDERQRVLAYSFSMAMGKRINDAKCLVLLEEERVRMTRFLRSYSRNIKAKHRQFAVELVSRLVVQHKFWNIPADAIPSELTTYSGVGPLIDLLVDRSRDKMSSVRAKAIAGLSATLALGLTGITGGDDDDIDVNEDSDAAAIGSSLQALLYARTVNQDGTIEYEETPLLIRLTELFREGLGDDKTFVRRAAVQALEAACVASPGGTVVHPSKRQDLFDIHGRCTDSSVIVRVQAIKSLSSILVRFPQDDDAQKLWNIGVLPLCVDAESTVQTNSVEWTNRVMFERMQLWYDLRRNDERREELDSVWSLVSHLDGVMAKCAQKALRLLVKDDKVNVKKLTRTCIHAIRHCVESYTPDQDEELNDPFVQGLSRYWDFSWIVLEEFALSGKLIEAAAQGEQQNLGIVVECWNKLQEQELPVAFNEGSKRILRVIAAISPVIDAQDAKEIADSILISLNSFAIPMNVISDAILALNSICKAKAPNEEAGREITFAWGKRLLDICEDNLRQGIDGSPEIIQEQSELLQKQLISIGDVALLEFDKDSEKNSDIALLPVSGALKALVQVFLPPKVTARQNHNFGDASGELPEEDTRSIASSAIGAAVVVDVPTPVRVCAFVTLGKLCLRDHSLAKGCITMFIRELRTCPVHDIRANILLILGDLSLRYTALVDAYVPTIALSLLDKSPLLRRSALLLFSQLILQDYIKWRESLLRFFLRAAVDKHEDLANLARHILCGPLLHKTPHLFSSKFVEMIFVLNGHEGKLIYSEPFEKEGVKELSLPGDDCFNQRAQLYQFLLQHMTDEQKLQISMKLCTEVLEEVTDGKLKLCNNPAQITASSTEAVLKDTFAILGSPDIKLSAGKEEDEDGGDVDNAAAGEGGSGNVAAQLAAAKGKLLSKMSKKNFLENVVPVLIGLKHKLESMHSPLMRNLLHYIRELFKLYRQEVKGIFMDSDPQMALELEYDLRQHDLREKQKQQEQGRRSMAPPSTEAAKTAETASPARTPSPPRRGRRSKKSKKKSALNPESPLDRPEATQTPIRGQKGEPPGSVDLRLMRRQSLPPTSTPRHGVRQRQTDSDEKDSHPGNSTLIFSPSKNAVATGSGGRWHVTASSPAIDQRRMNGEKFTQNDLEESMRKDLADAFDSASDSSTSDKEKSQRHITVRGRKKAGEQVKEVLKARRKSMLEDGDDDEEEEEPKPLVLKKKKKLKQTEKALSKMAKAKAAESDKYEKIELSDEDEDDYKEPAKKPSKKARKTAAGKPPKQGKTKAAGSKGKRKRD